jgi:hypothetical protein
VALLLVVGMVVFVGVDVSVCCLTVHRLFIYCWLLLVLDLLLVAGCLVVDRHQENKTQETRH